VQPGDLVRSNNLESWDVGGAGAGSAVDAHAYAGMVYDYYAKKHNRAGIDGQNGPLISTVHYDKNFVNAFFDGTQMVYGDGDDKEARSLAGALDIVGHEFTHGVTAATSGLIYIGQWGALNESVSDIFGCFVEHVNQPSEKGNWKNGEAIGLDPTFVRDLANPHNGNAQPAHMSEYRLTLIDNGGVHINSGIPNNAAYLMTMGGKNPVSGIEVAKGIGWEKAEKVWYRANAEYFGRTTMFRTAALDTIDAAIDLGLTDAEVDAIECAWIAVGVMGGECKQAPQEKNQAKTPNEGRGAGAGEGNDEAAATNDAREGDAPIAPASAGGCAQSRQHEAPNGAVASVLALLAGLATARIRRARR